MTDEEFKISTIREAAHVVSRLGSIEELLRKNAELLDKYQEKLDRSNSRIDLLDKKIEVMEGKVKIVASIFIFLGPIVGGLVSSLFTKYMVFN